MKERFNSNLQILLASKALNSRFLTKSKYLELVKAIRNLKISNVRKTVSDYHMLKRYDLVRIAGEDHLIYPISSMNPTMKFYTHTDELFDVIHRLHVAEGHAGKGWMVQELQSKYKNITYEIVVMYFNLCEVCQRRMK